MSVGPPFSFPKLATDDSAGVPFAFVSTYILYTHACMVDFF
jgi:hypothetical protein